jgi:hypothetical protein
MELTRLRFRAIPIGMIGTIMQVVQKLVYGRAEVMPNSLESMAVCDCYSHIISLILLLRFAKQMGE